MNTATATPSSSSTYTSTDVKTAPAIFYRTYLEVPAKERRALPHVMQYKYQVKIADVTSELSSPLYLMQNVTMSLCFASGKKVPANIRVTLFQSKCGPNGAPISPYTEDEMLVAYTDDDGKINWPKVFSGTWRVEVAFPRTAIISDNANNSNNFYKSQNPPSTRYIPGEWLNEKRENPSQCIYLTVNAHRAHQTNLNAYVLAPAMVCNMRSDATPDDLDTRNQLNQEEINYLTTHGNNVTIFIHGYDVEAGSWGKYIEDIEEHKDTISDARFIRYMSTEDVIPHRFIPILSTTPCTIWRDVKKLPQQFPPYKDSDQFHLEPSLYDDDSGEFNGTGAYNWFLNLEHNLNVAAGFNEKDYQHYTRIISVMWQGNPLAIDYMRAVDSSITTAKRLTELLKQLINAGLTVYVIAHSLGNSVLLHALNELGKAPLYQYDGKLDHIFLWDAAVPNHALSNYGLFDVGSSLNKLSYRQQQEITHYQVTKNPWCLPFATRPTKKITVLYSQNDNILGAIPITQPPGVNQADVDQDKPLIELLSGILFSGLNLQSVYHLAMTLGKPVTELLKVEVQEAFYQAFRKQCQPTADFEKEIVDYKSKLAYQTALTNYDPWLAKQIQQRQFSVATTFPATLDQQVKLLEDSGRMNLLEEKIDALIPEIETRLKAAGYSAITTDAVGFIIQHRKKIMEIASLTSKSGGILTLELGAEIKKLLIDGMDNLVEKELKVSATQLYYCVRRLQALVTTCFYETKNMPEAPAALGYQRPPENIINQLNNRLILADQTPWLWNHSGMRVPAERVKEHIYKQWIINPQKGINKFGEKDIK